MRATSAPISSGQGGHRSTVKGATTPACQPGGSAAAQVLTVPQPRRHDIPVTMAEMTGAKLLRLMSIEAGRLADIAARLPPGRAADEELVQRLATLYLGITRNACDYDPFVDC
jgi:hypothetical protein